MASVDSSSAFIQGWLVVDLLVETCHNNNMFNSSMQDISWQVLTQEKTQKKYSEFHLPIQKLTPKQ